MKQKWIVSRQTVQQTGGQRRWDLTYQCLLRWAQTAGREEGLIQAQQEVCYESSNLRSGIDTEAGPGPDHRTTADFALTLWVCIPSSKVNNCPSLRGYVVKIPIPPLLISTDTAVSCQNNLHFFRVN